MIRRLETCTHSPEDSAAQDAASDAMSEATEQGQGA